MAQTATLEWPDAIYQPAQRAAEATRRPLRDVPVNALRASLPPVEDLPPALIADLFSLENLNDDELERVMISRVPDDHHRTLNRLLRKNKTGKLTPSDQRHFAALQHEANRIMLRKARAAVLLRFRGHRLPTQSELRKLTFSQ